ncbi:MAG: RtcB family protein, partial [Candidatus Hydrogenedentes bacterium]|nr:RtcB family protein [Candidatus Hydrogenedentota bacterium]
MTDAGEVHIIRTAKSWIEGSAVQQLEKVATLPGVCRAVGMPDLHPGRGYPIGAAVLCRGMFYPHLVGNDIGCGMGLW